VKKINMFLKTSKVKEVEKNKNKESFKEHLS
jgi:hypothetical protein